MSEVAASDQLRAGMRVRGLNGPGEVVLLAIEWHGDSLAEIVFRDADGHTGSQTLFPEQIARLEVVDAERPWGFDADPGDFWLGLEARRIGLASLFDPVLAVHSSLVEPLPHQILAVYGEMLPRQPLRFLLADDPGAGKTIMAGLLIKELQVRGDLERCLIICPGSLAEQWQDELHEKFRLGFEIATNDKLEASRTGNWFTESPRVIARVDKLARDERVQDMLRSCSWDLVIVDEAHKLSASYFGGEKKETKRYKLGKLVSPTTRHFLLMTATPHNGKEEDFQLFLALLDGDRFEGKYRDGVHVHDPSDLMRRLTKEQLYRFDGTPLFPERRAYVVGYELSDLEAGLYAAVTDYVRDEFQRAERLDGNQRSSVGFALTILQRRLASSPEAIYQSLRRRRERLESEAADVRTQMSGRRSDLYKRFASTLDEEFDEEDLAGEELEGLEAEVVGNATSAQTLAELQAEIATLKHLEAAADEVRRSGRDTKWAELRELLMSGQMFDAEGRRRKLVIFTEHRDTLTYLERRIRDLIGRPEAVITIAGGMARDERRKAENAFRNDPEVEVLIATDAAGEGINLQRGHLMVNYDLPWNPNRLEQRFGRIHRIGQTEVCHLWNLVAVNTREGDVYRRLLEKLEQAREALGGAVFDVLGRVIQGQALKDLLVEAIRYGQSPDVMARLFEKVDNAADREEIRRLIESDALARDAMDTQKVQEVRAEMERARLTRMQPRYVEGFFQRAFERLGGRMARRESGMWEVKHVPSSVLARDRQAGGRAPLLSRYERVTFEKDVAQANAKADFICPGHPLLDATLGLAREQFGRLLRNGSVLIDDADLSDSPWALITLEHEIADPDRTISRRMLFVRVEPGGRVRDAGFAPHVDLRPPTPEERAALEPSLSAPWLREELERTAKAHAMRELVPPHMAEVQSRRTEWLDKARREVHRRLTHEITHWNVRAQELHELEKAGKQPRMNALEAERRAEDLTARLRARMEEIDRQRSLVCGVPHVSSGCFVAPRGLLDRLLGREPDPEDWAGPEERARIDRLAVAAVMRAERALGRIPKEMPHNHPCYDIESAVAGPDGQPLGDRYFIEVKGKAPGRETVTISRNQINASFNHPDRWILAVVRVDGETTGEPVYVRRPFDHMQAEQVASVNFRLSDLLTRGGRPE